MTAGYARLRHPPASLASIRVADTMHRGIVTCRSDATLSTVARVLAAHRIHAVAVVPKDDSDEWRIVSDLDLMTAVDQGRLTATAGEIASGASVFVAPEDALQHAVRLMREHDTHHVIVLRRGSWDAVGIVSTLDVADAVAELRQLG